MAARILAARAMSESKYRNRPTSVDGYTFASKAEARRYQELRLAERAGSISGLVVHPRFPLVVNGRRCGIYEADFAYDRDGTRVVEDVKGVRTAVYRLKKRLVAALYDLAVTEIDA